MGPIEKKERTILRKVLKTYGGQIKNIHKERKLEFSPIEIWKARNLSKVFLHKSPTYNRRQSSAYWLAYYNEHVIYVRISNHWGYFHTNSKTEFDSEGRPLWEWHDWTLEDGNNPGYTSRAGYIVLRFDE